MYSSFDNEDVANTFADLTSFLSRMSNVSIMVCLWNWFLDILFKRCFTDRLWLFYWIINILALLFLTILLQRREIVSELSFMSDSGLFKKDSWPWAKQIWQQTEFKTLRRQDKVCLYFLRPMMILFLCSRKQIQISWICKPLVMVFYISCLSVWHCYPFFWNCGIRTGRCFPTPQPKLSHQV